MEVDVVLLAVNRLNEITSRRWVELENEDFEACRELAKAFPAQDVVAIDVDYGSLHRAITIDIKYAQDYEIMARREAGGELITFGIYQDGTEIYAGEDNIADFGKHLDEYVREKCG